MNDFVKKFFDKSFWKFILVGLLNTLIGTGINFVLLNVTSLGYWWSSAIAYVVGSIVSFILNKRFTFKNKDNVALAALKFALVIAVCYFSAFITAKPLVALIFNKLISQNANGIFTLDNISTLAATGLFTVLNYVGQRWFAFNRLKK